MKRLTFLIIFISILLFFSVSFAQKGIRVKGKSQAKLPGVVYRTGWALLVGINKYPNLPAQHQLHYAVADAEALSRLLKKKFGFNESKILRDEKATKKGILDALGDLADGNKVKKDDCVLIFYSGHGQTVPLSRGGGDMGFLVPYDAKVNLSAKPNFSQYFKSCIGMDELKRVSRGIPAKHILFIVDACYSGLAIQASKGLSSDVPGYLKKVVRADVEQMITAGGKGEMSMESSELGHGVFTHKLLEGLEKEIADWNDDGVITGMELGTYLRNTVSQMAKQTPNFRREGEGEFLFLPQVEVIVVQPEDEQSDEGGSVQPIKSTATLFVDAVPKGASVSVDGRNVGTTPCTVKIDTGFEGKRKVTIAVSKKGYLTQKTSTNLVAGKRSEWKDVRLTRLVATLGVESSPKGASVHIDGKLKGTTPCTIKVDVGVDGKLEAMVTVSKEGYLTQRAKVKLIAGKTTRWTNIRLEKAHTPPPEPSQSIDQFDDSGVDEVPDFAPTKFRQKDGMKMVLIPGGKFMMGSNDGDYDEKPVHDVYVDSFYMDEHEVTNEQYCKFLNAISVKVYGKDWRDSSGKNLIYNGPSLKIEKSGNRFKPKAGYKNHPVIDVYWAGAKAYAEWVGGRLPTEAEWERAARGGLVGKKYPNGNSISHDDANYEGTGGKDRWEQTAPVKSFAPNAYKLYDMAGNVYEWCSDYWNADYYSKSPKNNPTGPSSGSYHVIRGGSWWDDSNRARCGFRLYYYFSYDLVGFRVLVARGGSE